jgi:RNA polymerase sigma factor (sigma-70 family)
MESYYNEPLLKPGEDVVLGRLVQAGNAPDATAKDKIAGRKAKNRMILANVRLVTLLANRRFVKCNSLTISDLVQEGLMGVSYAVDKFDPTRGYKFTTYARNWISHYIDKAIAFQDRLIRVPMDVSAELYRMQSDQAGHTVYPDQQRRCSKEAMSAAIMANNVISLAYKREGSSTDIEELIVDEKSLKSLGEYDLTRQELDLYISQLDERESYAVRAFYGLDGEFYSLDVIAEHLGFKNKSSVRRIKRIALDKLKEMISDSNYSCFRIG